MPLHLLCIRWVGHVRSSGSYRYNYKDKKKNLRKTIINVQLEFLIENSYKTQYKYKIILTSHKLSTFEKNQCLHLSVNHKKIIINIQLFI